MIPTRYSGIIVSAPPTTNSSPASFTSGAAFLEIIESAPVAMLLSDRDGVIGLTNAEARRMLGYTETELRGLTVAALLPKKSLGRLQAFFAHFWLVPERRPVDGGPEFQMLCKDGGEIWVQMGFNPVRIGGTVFALGAVLDIGARKLAEKARAESERTMRAILDHSFEFIGLLDTEGRILRANHASLGQAGVKWEDVQGRLFWETPWWAHSPAEQTKLRDAVRRAARGEFVRFETTHTGTGGSMLDIDFSLKPVRDEDGCVSGLIPEGRDITERKCVERALRESEEKFSKVFHSSPDAISVHELESGACVDANENFLRLFGYSRTELIGRRPVDLGIWPDLAQREGYVEILRTHGTVRDFPARVRLRSGEIRLVQMSSDVVEIGGSRHNVTVLHDMTDKLQAERTLRESEEKFSKAFRASPDAISVSDLSTGHFLDVNEGYEQLSGYKRAELIGRTSSEMGIWSNPGDREKILEELNRSGSVRDMQLKARTHSGELKTFLLSAEKIEIGGRPCVVVVSRDITVRMQAEQALRESEEKFAAAFRVSPDIMSISDYESGNYIEVNEAHERIFGFSRAESIGHSPLELGIIPTDSGLQEEMLRLLQKEGRLRDFKAHARNRRGEHMVVLLSAEFIQFGGRKCVLRVSRDITARLQAEQALRESEEKFSKAFRASPDAIAITDLETGHYIEANGGHEQIFGFTREEVIGRTTLELGYYRNPEDRARMVAEIRAHGAVHNLELPCLNRRGEPITVLYSGEAIEVNGRKCLVSVIRDITSRKRAEEALRDSEARFRSYFESPFIGMAITSADRRWLEVNDHLCRMLGYPREELLRMSWSEITVAEDVNKNDALLGRVMAGELDGCTFEKRYRRKDGGILYANLSTRSFRRGDGTLDYFLTVIQDITEKHEAEETRAGLENQLRQAQKLEALGTLAGGIAHDFNNILTAMIVYRELAVMDIDRPADLRKHLAEIGQASTRAKELVRQILTFSRQQKQERRAVRLHPVVKEALQLLRSSLPSTIEMDLHIDEQSPEVLADTGQVHQIVMNLATNAAHAMRDRHGRLTVRLVPRQLDEEFCRIQSGLRPGLYAQLSVTDMGHGMDETTLGHIFEPFFTTKGPGEGTGLGLAVVHGIMEDHDGTIAVRSRVGGGTTFDLFFPQYLGIIRAAVEQDAGIPRGRGESVLLVDDERPLCDAIGAVLQKLGYRMTVCTDPMDAVARFRAAPLDFDVLLTDHTMPQMTGLDVIREVHAVRPGLPVLLVSGLSGTWTPEKLRGFDIRELVAKPLDLASLAQAVRRALDHPRNPTI